MIRGTRFPVEYILNLLAHGAKEIDILDEYKGLNAADIQACILFATKSLENTDFMPLIEESAWVYPRPLFCKGPRPAAVADVSIADFGMRILD